MQGAHISYHSIVQGVGFRPFVYNLATRLELKGWVNNTSAGVDIHIEGMRKPSNPLSKNCRVKSLRWL